MFHFINAQIGLLSISQVAVAEEVVDDLSRLVHLEHSVAVLWEQMKAAGQWAEQRHSEVMKLYTEALLGGGGRGEAWLTSLMEQQLQRFRTLLDQKRRQVSLNPKLWNPQFINSFKTISIT